MKFLVINGPNLNLLGIREPDIYGEKDYVALCSYINETAAKLGVNCEIYQSNHEGDIVDKIQSLLELKTTQKNQSDETIGGENVKASAEYDGYENVVSSEAISGIVINPAAYTHTSIAILDALKAVSIPTVEVHLTDIHSREEFRNVSVTGGAALKVFYGLGFAGYGEAMRYLKDYILHCA